MLYVSSDSEDGEVDVDVNDLQVYTALVSEHDGLFKKATGAGCALVLPPNQGLPRSITRKFLEHHILRPSRLFKGQYCTLASKTTEVENRDNKFLITIGTGWKYCCKAAISRMDTFYTSSGAPYHVFYTKRHLLSGADLLQNMSSEKTHPDRLQLPGTEEAAKKTISRLSISRHIDGEVHAFDRAYILIPGCAEDAAGKVKQLFHRCSEIVQAKCDSVPPTAKNSEALYCCTATQVMLSLHSRLWPYWVLENAASDQRFSAARKAIQLHKTLADLVDPPFTELNPSDLRPAFDELDRLQTTCTPIGKMVCAKRCMDRIGELASDEERRELSADSMLPVLAYTVAASATPSLKAHCSFIASFAPDYFFQSELGYAFISLQAALSMVDQEGMEIIKQHGTPETPSPEVSIRADEVKLVSESLRSEPLLDSSSSPRLKRTPTAPKHGLFSTHRHSLPPESTPPPSTLGTPPGAARKPTARQAVLTHITTHQAKDSGDFLKGLLDG